MNTALPAPHSQKNRFQILLFFSAFAILLIYWGIPLTPFPKWEKFVTGRFAMSGFLILAAAATVFLASKFAGDFESFFEQYQNIFIFLFFTAYAFIMISICLLRHEAMDTQAFDLGIFDQGMWTTLHGRLLYSSFKDGICLLGDHMSPAFLFFVPLYAIWSSPKTLLVAQAILTAASIFPLAWITQEKLGKGIFPVLFAFSLFLYNPLRNSVRSDFHPELLANPLLLLAFYFLMKERIKPFLITLIPIILCKENMYGISFIFGFYLLLQKRFRLGIFLMIVSIFLLYVSTQVLIPLISGKPYLYQGNYAYLLNGKWGTDPPLIVHPFKLLIYLQRIFLPVSIFFIHPPTLLLTFPILFQNLLSRNPMMHSTAFQYTSGLTPFVFIAAIYGTQEVLAKIKGSSHEKSIRYGIAILLVLLPIFFHLRPERYYLLTYRKALNPHKEMVKRRLAKIPGNLSVIAPTNLTPRLSQRFEIRPYEDYAEKTLNADLVILDREWVKDLDAHVKRVQAVGYQTIFSSDGFFVLKRR